MSVASDQQDPKTDFCKGGKEVRLEHADNTLAGLSRGTIKELARSFAREHGLEDHVDAITAGALVAADPAGTSCALRLSGEGGADGICVQPAFESLDELSEEDKTHLRREVTHSERLGRQS